MEAFGRGAHVGNAPEEGRSAIKELAYKILDIEALTDWSKGLNLNVGVIEGGTVHNSAPAYAKMIVDMRFTDPAMLEAMKAKFQEINDKVYVDGVTCKMTPVSLMQPMVELESSKELFELVKKFMKKKALAARKQLPLAAAVILPTQPWLACLPCVLWALKAAAIIRLMSLPMWNRCLCVPN